MVFVALIAGILTVPSITICFILVGMCCAYQILAIYKVSTYVPDELAGLATAVPNMIIMIFGYAFHSVIGFIINAYGGVRDTTAFVYGAGVIPATLVLGIAGFLYFVYQERVRAQGSSQLDPVN